MKQSQTNGNFAPHPSPHPTPGGHNYSKNILGTSSVARTLADAQSQLPALRSLSISESYHARGPSPSSPHPAGALAQVLHPVKDLRCSTPLPPPPTRRSTSEDPHAGSRAASGGAGQYQHGGGGAGFGARSPLQVKPHDITRKKFCAATCVLELLIDLPEIGVCGRVLLHHLQAINLLRVCV